MKGAGADVDDVQINYRETFYCQATIQTRTGKGATEVKHEIL